MSDILAFNTGRLYTGKGQRIGAIRIGDGVFMSDQDRGIHIYLPDCPLDRYAIMRRYDYNDRCEWRLPVTETAFHSSVGHLTRWEIIAKLDEASKDVTP